METNPIINSEPSLIKPNKPYTGKTTESAYETLRTVVLILMAAFLIRSFVIQPFVVEGKSMEPTLRTHQYLIIDKLSYRLGEPKRGDIIVFRAPVNLNQNYIKRIIGLPGETVALENGRILIDGKMIDESYLLESLNAASSGKLFASITLASDEYFVLGDNRDNSSDSRSWGALPKKNIVGRAILTVFPPPNVGFIKAAEYSH